ncbi:MAG TPA: MFS transporter [Prolixibacteraceae bacterium]|jgi:nitroimidazol reductase NimA-like FMN-containing flavoprotein (pyridoxamine 5'-phosphate oxidase superfamily)|nr:MFS transporter [Prolixibacteraceae bacterium]
MRTHFIEDRNEIDAILKQCRTCYVAMSDNDVPYVLPMNFGMDGDRVILHSAQEGRMWETIKKNPKVCISWTLGEGIAWQDQQVGCSYRVQSKSVLIEGTVEIIDDFQEKERLFRQFMTQYSDLAFKFNAPAIRNVGVFVVPITRLTAKVFGEKVKK